MLGDDAIVTHSIGRIDSQCTIVRTHADGMKASHALEVQRRMTRIRLEELELFISQIANRLR